MVFLAGARKNTKNEENVHVQEFPVRAPNEAFILVPFLFRFLTGNTPSGIIYLRIVVI